MNRFLSLVLLALAVLSATGCNTIAGVGKDIQKAGDTIEDAAKKR